MIVRLSIEGESTHVDLPFNDKRKKNHFEN